MSDKTEANNSSADFDELVNKISGLAESASGSDAVPETADTGSADYLKTDQADAAFSAELNETENLDSPDSDYDGFDGANIVSLFDDDGNEYEFELLDYVDYNDKLYAVMIPSELTDVEDDEVAVIMETYFEGNEPNFVFVDDEDLAQKVLDAYSAESGD